MSQDLDISYAGPLIDDWMENLQEITVTYKRFVNNNPDVVLRLQVIQESTIEAAFKLTEYLQLTPHIKYMAIYLFEEFMYKHFLQVHKVERKNGLQERDWDTIYNDISNKAKLRLLSCFQLACKMDSRCIRIEISQILKLLEIIDDRNIYTYNMVISSETEVFKTVGFKIPFNTPLTYIEILLAITDQRDEVDYEIALLLLDVAFLQREELYSRFERKLSRRYIKPESLIFLRSNVLFLSAAVVACTKLYRNKENLESIVEILAIKSLSGKTDIMMMTNILFQMTM